MTTRLYSYWRSSCSYRARIALAFKGVEYAYEAVDLERDGGQQRAPDYRAKNPLMQVPTLEWTEGGRVLRLSQSLAIVEWLEERHPTPPLLPDDPFERAKARQIAEMINAGIQPFQNLSMTLRLNALGVDGVAFGRDAVERGLVAVEREVARTAGRHCVGDAVSVADVCLVPQLFNARRMGLDDAQWPTLAGIDARCAALPAFVAAHPDAQPDAGAG